MSLSRTFGVIVSFGLGVFLFVPLAVVVWELLLTPGHQETFVLVIIGAHELTGWQMWLFVSSLALTGAMLILLGIYVLRSRNSAA